MHYLPLQKTVCWSQSVSITSFILFSTTSLTPFLGVTGVLFLCNLSSNWVQLFWQLDEVSLLPLCKHFLLFPDLTKEGMEQLKTGFVLLHLIAIIYIKVVFFLYLFGDFLIDYLCCMFCAGFFLFFIFVMCWFCNYYYYYYCFVLSLLHWLVN